MMNREEREELMLARYGEVCNRMTAALILSKSPGTISRMLKDGRIDSACAGTMVDVRSLAAYITEPKKAEFECKKRKSGMGFYV